MKNVFDTYLDKVDEFSESKSVKPRLLAGFIHGVILLTVCLLLLAVYFLGWGAYLLMLVALVVACLLVWTTFKRRRSDERALESAQPVSMREPITDFGFTSERNDDTVSFAPIDESIEGLKEVANFSTFSAWQVEKPKIKPRTLKYREDGSPYLEVKQIHSRRGQRTKLGTRQLMYQVEVTEIDLNESSLVDIDLAERIEIIPSPGETDIIVLRRMSWWERGPSQITIAVSWVMSVFILTYVVLAHTLPVVLIFSVWILLTLGLAGLYFVIWMKWAYKYLIVTNKRVGVLYNPPFRLPGEAPNSQISSVQINEANDQSWFANALGWLNPAWTYGKLNLDTAAQEDEWMKNIRFVLEHQPVSEAIAAVQSQSNQQVESDDQRKSRALADRANQATIDHFSEQQ